MKLQNKVSAPSFAAIAVVLLTLFVMSACSSVKTKKTVDTNQPKANVVPCVNGGDKGVVLDAADFHASGKRIYWFDPYVIEVEEHKESVGENITVWYRPAELKIRLDMIPKEYRNWPIYAPDEIREDKPDGDSYFMGVYKHWMLLDSGTAPPPRGLAIYDLNIKKRVHYGSYSPPVFIEGHALIFWTEVEAATRANCPDYDKFIKQYVSNPGIDGKVSLDFRTLHIKRLGETKCNPRQ